MDLNITNIQSTLASVRWDKTLQKEIKNSTKFLSTKATWSERLFCIDSKIEANPTCSECGAITKFRSFTKGYNRYCSNKCRHSSVTIKNKRRLTNMNRYGGASPMNSEAVKKKALDTMDMIYGVENPSQLADVKEKKKATLKASYGVENPSHSKVIQERKRKTYQKKYGKDHWTQDTKKNKAFIKQLVEHKMSCKKINKEEWVCKTCDYPFHSVEKSPECPVCSQTKNS